MKFSSPVSRLFTKMCPSLSLMSGPLLACQPKVSLAAVLSVRPIQATLFTKCIVVNLNVAAIQYEYAVVAIDEDVSGANRPFGDFEEESIIAWPEPFPGKRGIDAANVLEPVVDDSPVNVAHVIPDAVRIGQVGDKVVPARNTAALIEYLHPRGKVSCDVLDIVASEDISLQQNVGRANDVNPFGTRVAH